MKSLNWYNFCTYSLFQFCKILNPEPGIDCPFNLPVVVVARVVNFTPPGAKKWGKWGKLGKIGENWGKWGKLGKYGKHQKGEAFLIEVNSKLRTTHPSCDVTFHSWLLSDWWALTSAEVTRIIISNIYRVSKLVKAAAAYLEKVWLMMCSTIDLIKRIGAGSIELTLDLLWRCLVITIIFVWSA